MSYTVKPAAARHLAELPEIERAATAVFPPDDLPSPAQLQMISASEFERAQANDRLWVAVDANDSPVGFLMAELLDDALHITEMDVHPEHARRGLGVTLLRHVLLEAEHRGQTSVTLTTFSHLPWNAPFYQRNGFAELRLDDCGPELRARLANETERGLRNRVAMRRQVRRVGRAPHWGDA